MHTSLLEGGSKIVPDSPAQNEVDDEMADKIVYDNKTKIKDIVNDLQKINLDVFTFKTNPMYIPADLDSEDENFKDYVESKNAGTGNYDDEDLKSINFFIDEKYRDE